MCILQSMDKTQSHTHLTDNTQNFTVKEIVHNKENFMELLLIGDEEEKMVLKYLKTAKLYALYDLEILKSICAVVKKDNKTVEIKNLATYPKFQNQGCASFLLTFIFEKYKDFKYVILGTGENEKTLNFYKSKGFVEFGRIENFFTKNYSHPIFENGIQLKDMIFLKKKL